MKGLKLIAIAGKQTAKIKQGPTTIVPPFQIATIEEPIEGCFVAQGKEERTHGPMPVQVNYCVEFASAGTNLVFQLETSPSDELSEQLGFGITMQSLVVAVHEQPQSVPMTQSCIGIFENQITPNGEPIAKWFYEQAKVGDTKIIVKK